MRVTRDYLMSAKELLKMNIKPAPSSGFGWAPVEMWRRSVLAGAKAHVVFVAFAARLKSCPVTKPQSICSCLNQVDIHLIEKAVCIG